MWVKRLRNRLGALVADPNVSVWDDAYIKPGKLWAAAAADAIVRARVAVLFVSRNFDQSTYITETELPLLRANCEGDHGFPDAANHRDRGPGARRMALRP